MKTKLKVLAGLILLIFLTTSLTLVALAETPSQNEGLFNDNEVSLAPGGIGLLATISVNTTDDGVGDDNQCTLREAIIAANTDTASGAQLNECPAGSGASDTITLIAGTYVLTDTANGDLDITTNVTIQGVASNTTTINGNATDRVFDITSAGVVTISDVTITNGRVTSAGEDGGGIWNKGTLTLNDSIVSNNHVQRGSGGGIFNEDGTVTINNSTVSQNTATHVTDETIPVGGGIANSAEGGNASLTINQSNITTNTVTGVGGGGISNGANANRTATVALSQTLVSGNVATSTVVTATSGFGGGIRNGFFSGANNAVSTLTVENSTISGNSAINGGGIGSGTSQTGAGLTLSAILDSSTVSGNTTTTHSDFLVGNGGGLINVNSTLSLVNSTVSGNEANGTQALAGGRGGGIFNGDLGKATTLWLTNTTVSSNTAAATNGGDGVANYKAGGTTATVNFKNSIIAGGCANGVTGFPATVGTLTSQGHNVDDDNTCALTATGDITGTNPLLGPLQDNGGDTETHAILSDASPAVDAGDNTVCAATPVDGVDQRGETRPNAISTICDIGAYESPFKPASTGDSFLPIIIKNS